MGQLLISLLSGIVGGNIAGGLLRTYNMGVLVNSLAGIIGGGIGGKLLAMAGPGALATGGGMGLGAILPQMAAGAFGGGVLLTIVAVVRNMMSKA
jgi:uncharacterized membrane protein YeaQ/YmgE (transglycosylase-associated protein family)